MINTSNYYIKTLRTSLVATTNEHPAKIHYHYKTYIHVESTKVNGGYNVQENKNLEF